MNLKLHATVLFLDNAAGNSCNLVYFISARTYTEIIIEMICHKITQFQRPASYSVLETYERRGLHMQVILM
jgi:hypothetical protein